ncbi:MAG: hypothetical protein ACI4I1_03705 [Oscillospiraceae bacterium]
MKVKKRLSRMIAGITAFMLVLTPLPLDELGVLANGISMTVNAEENGDPNENGANTGSENGEGGENGTNTGSENGEGGENGTNTGSENGGDDENDANTESTAFNEKNNVTEGDEEQGEISISLASLGLPDNDELFEGYVYRAFYGNTSFYSYQGSGYNSLSTDAEKEIYDLLKPELSKIANGQRASTSIEITLTNSWTSTSDSLHRITWALLTDFPYDVYWFDKTSGLGLSYIGNTYTFNFSVASDYAGSSAYTVNTTKTGAASSAAANAQTIVNNYAALSDFEKLDGYRAEICGLVEYNNDALAVGTPYGDPWQLIYVFDGNSSTNVVCEGYSKAFQYLCDLTEFDNDTIECALVTGTMVANGSGGGHMWNIVSIDDVSYVVDVTNCDSGTVGYPDELFLKGMTNVSGDGFTAALSSNVVYTYDTDTKATFDSTFLTVSAKDYSESSSGTYDEVKLSFINSGYVYWLINDTTLKTGSSDTVYKGDVVTLCLNFKDYVGHKLTINGVDADLQLSADRSCVNTILKIDGSVEEIVVDYVESEWSNDELAKYTQLIIDEKISVIPYNDVTYEFSNYHKYETGDYYVKNESFYIQVELNDYINHKVLVNGTEVEMYINGDTLYQCGYKVIDSHTTVVELKEEKWSDEKLSEFVKLDINENISVYPFNFYSKQAVIEKPLHTGDYYPKGQELVIRIPEAERNGEAIIINGVKTAGEVNDDGDYQLWRYPVNCNSDTLTIGLESEYAKLNVGENVSVYALNEDTGDADTSISFKTGDYCLKNAKIFISVKLNDYIDHKVVVNGNDVELSINGDNVCYCGSYTVTGSSVTIELQTEKWSDEKLSQYVKLEIGETVNVYPYNEFSDSAVLGCQLHTGDYYPKNKKLVIRIPEDVRNGKAILINGVQVDGEVNGDGDYQIWKYLVDCSGNTLTINTESALNLTEKNGAAKNFDTLVEAFTYINKYGNSQAEYTITLNSDISVSSLTLPAATKAANITFNGEGSLKLNMTSLSIPTNVTFDVPIEGTNATALTISVVAGKTLTINGVGSRNIGKISGTATSVLNIKQFLTVGGIATFKEVNVADEKAVSVEGNVTGVTHFNGALWLKNPKYTATITNIGTADLVLYDIDGANAKVTISNIDEDGSLNVTLVDSLFNEIAVASGRTILWAGSTVDFTSKVTVANKTSTAQNLTAYLYGKEIKAEYGGAVTLSRLLEDKSWQEIRTYPNFDLAFKAMTDANVEYKVFLNEDISVSNLILPTKAKSITFTSSALDIKTLTVSSTAVTLSNNVTFENIKLETTNASGLTITANKNVDITMLHSSTLKTINGTSASYISFDVGEGYLVGYSISGFGTLIVCDGVVGFNTAANGTTSVKAGTLKLIGGEIMGARFIAGSCSAVFTNIESVGSKTEIIYDKSNQNPITVNGKVTAENPILISASGGKTFKQNNIVLISKTADLSKFKLNENSLPDDGIEYTLAREGSNVKVKGAVYELSDGGEGSVKYASWADVVAAMNSSTTDYTVKLLADVTEGNITFPAAAKAKSVTLTGGKKLTVANTALTLPTNVTFDNIQIETTNASGLTITASKNVDIWGLESSTLKTINGTSASYISFHGSDGYNVSYNTSGFGTLIVQSIVGFNTDANGTTSIKAGTLKLMGVEKLSVGSCSAVFTNIESVGSNNKIVYSDISNIKPITVNGKVTADNPISISSGGVNKFKQNDTVLISKTADLSKFKIAENSLPDDGIEYTLAREGSDVKVKGAVYELSDGGEGSVKYASWSDVVAAMNSSTTDYTVKLLADVTEGNITFPAVTKANSVTLTGGKKLTIANTTLTLPTNVTFGDIQIETTNTRSGLTITASKNFTVNGLTSASLKAVNGGAASVFKIAGNSEFIYYSISGFNTIDAAQYGVNFLNTVKATKLIIEDNASVFIGSKLVSFTNVEAGADTCIMYNKNISVPLAISGKVTASEPISLLALDDNGNPTTFKANDIVLTSTTADLSKFKIADSSIPNDGIEYTLERDGANVKVMGAVYQLSSGENVIGKYSSWAKVVAAMNDKNTDYTVTLLADVTEGNITFPAANKAKSVAVYGNGNTFTIANTALTLPTDVIFGSTKLESSNTRNGLKITASKNLIIQGFYGLSSKTLKTINGSANSVLKFYCGAGYNVTYSISGFGTVVIPEFDIGFNVGGETATTVKATNLVLGGASTGATLLVGNCNATFTNVTYSEYESGNVYINYADTTNIKPISITGKVTADTPIIIGAKNGTFADNDTVLISKTADLSKFKVNEINLPESTLGYTLASVGTNVKIMGVKFKLSYGTTEAYFAQWSDILNTIAENAKNGNKDEKYAVVLLDDVNIGGALTMPKAGTFGSLTVQGNGDAKTLTFTGTTVSLTGTTSFSNLILKSEKDVRGVKSYVDFSFNAGKNTLILAGVTGKIKDIISSGTVSLGGTTINGNVSANSLEIYEGTEPTEPISAGGIQAMNSFVGKAPAATSVRIKGNLSVTNVLTLNSSLTVKGSFSAAGINSAADSENVALVLCKNEKKPAVIGKNGFGSNSNKIKFALVDSSTGLTTQIAEDTVIATISGKYADNLIPCDDNLDTDEQSVGYYIVKENGKLIAKPKNAPQGFVQVICNGKTAYYTSLDSAIKDINATGTATDVIFITLTQDMFSEPIAKLPLPNAGKYASLVYVASGNVTIKVTSDITLTGNLSINENVMINKVNKNGEVLPISVNVGKYNMIAEGWLSAKSNESKIVNQIANISGAGKFTANKDVVVTGRVNVGTFVFRYNTVTLKGKTASFTGSVSVDTEGTLEYDKANAKNVKFNNVSGDPLTVKIADVVAGDTITAITSDYTKGGIKIDGSDLIVVRSGGYLKAFNESDAITVKEFENSSFKATRLYDTLENAMADINRLNNKNARYCVNITNANGKTYSKLPLPAAGKYKLIVFVGTGTINVSSDITLTGNSHVDPTVTINKIDRNNNVVEMSVNAGNYEFTCGGKLSYDATKSVSQLKNVSGKGLFELYGDATVSGNVNVGKFYFSGTITLGEKAGFAGNVLTTDYGGYSTNLKYPVAVGKNVKLGTIKDDYSPGKLNVEIEGVSAGTQIATLTGDYIAGTVVINDGSEFTAVRSGTKLIAVAKGTEVTVSDGTNTRAYDTYANAIADITRLNNASGEYVITLPEGTYTLTSLTLPARGKYASIEIAASGAANIEVRSDVSLTGNVVIGTNVTLKKVKVFGGDPVTPFKFTSAKNRDGSPVYTVKTNGGTIVNGNLNGAEIQDISGD